MIIFQAGIPLLAAVFLLALTLLHLGRGRGDAQKSYFILSCLILAGSQLSLGSMLLSAGPAGAMMAFRFFFVFTAFLPVFLVPFLSLFGRKPGRTVFRGPGFWAAAVIILTGLAALAAVPQLVVREVHFSQGAFWGFTFTTFGKLVGVYLLLMNVLGLFYLENTFRSASIAGRTTMKYPLLGILIVTVLTFTAISRILAIAMTDKNYLVFHSCGLIAFCSAFFFATFRYRLFDVQAYLGRDVVTSVLTVTISGLYLLALALVSLLARILNLPYDRFAAGVIGLFMVFLLLAVLVSGRAKRRLRHFIQTNFYSSRYDYRKEWPRYARLMGSSETVDEFLLEFINLLCDTMLVEQGLIWVNVKGGKYAGYGLPEIAIEADAIKQLTAPAGHTVWFRSGGSIINPENRSGSMPDLDWVQAAAAIGEGENQLGWILLGDRTMAMNYTGEDRECLATLADQAALALENLLIKEQMVDSKQLESFNRFSSFVIHDLKNAIGILSLTAENARDNLDDPEFQADAFVSIERSIDKMKGLIHSLNALKAPPELTKKELDLTGLANRVIQGLIPVAGSRKVQLKCDTVESVMAEADGSALERVIQNLLMNGIEAAGEGGRVTLAVAARQGGWAELTVADTGVGFEPAYLREHLFRPFRTTKKSGLGIGLVMCRTLVRAHGGDLIINSEPGRGAVVTVRLPAASPGDGSPEDA